MSTYDDRLRPFHPLSHLFLGLLLAIPFLQLLETGAYHLMSNAITIHVPPPFLAARARSFSFSNLRFSSMTMRLSAALDGKTLVYCFTKMRFFSESGVNISTSAWSTFSDVSKIPMVGFSSGNLILRSK